MDHDLEPTQSDIQHRTCPNQKQRISRLEVENEELRVANELLIRIVGSFTDVAPADPSH